MKTKWNFEILLSEALKYQHRTDFFKQSLGAYKSAIKQGVLDEICQHMIPKPLNWTKDKVAQEALKYSNRGIFAKNNGGAYNFARKNKLLDEICQHMIPLCRTWSEEEVKKEALKYNARGEFALKSNKEYQAAKRMRILDEICQHMKQLHNDPYTKKSLLNEVSKYSTISEFVKYNKSAYNAAHRQGILDEICQNLDKNYWRWSYVELQQEALKYNTRKEFIISNQSAYVTATNRKILDEICQHMKKPGDISKAQKELFDYIKTVFPSVKQLKLRKIKIINKPYIKGFDIDIYISELHKGIEFDGTYWHSLEGLKRSRSHWPNKDLKNYHKIKDEYFKSKGIKILHIKESNWIKNKEKCINKCLKFLK